MLLETARFGRLEYEARDLLLFTAGLIGFEQLHAWVLLREDSLSWLQAVEDPRIALPLVSPFPYVPDYCLQLPASECQPLQLTSDDNAVVLVVVGQNQNRWTLNLRAPLILRPELRLGRQVVTVNEHSLQHALPLRSGSIRKCA